jgi:predicted O-linked N-acetylglucosamine transferase (SPINDLY family)
MSQSAIRQTFELALQHHQKGRLQEAEHLYRQLLAQQPTHIDALHNLGVLALQTRRYDLAADLLRQVIALRPGFPEAHANLGIALRNLRQLDEAIAALRQALSLNANFAEAHSNLADALKEKGQVDQAIAAYRRALALKPDLPEVHNNLGSALKDKGQVDEAVAEFRRATALKPNLAEAHANLGIALNIKGQAQESLAVLRRAIALKPDFAEAHNNLGSVLREQGRLDEAVAAYGQAILLRPDYVEAHNNLGIALKDQGRLEQAAAAFGRAIVHQPHYAPAHGNLGNVLKDLGRLEEAIAAYREAIELNPDSSEAHYNLAIALTEAKQPDAAIANYQRAISLRPDYADALNNLGNVFKDQGQLDEAIAAYRKAIAFDPQNAINASNLLLVMHYHPAYDANAQAKELRRWSCQHAEPMRKFIRPHRNDPNPDRRLRIGYVSADFWAHASALFLIPLLDHHDPRQVEVFCYAQVSRPDATTRRFQQRGHSWRNIASMSDDQTAEQIRKDNIDILVDLKLHTGQNRLLLFARKPAPVQATWLGYPGTTGLDTMDYRLSDPFLDPPEMDESVYAEKTIRLPDTFWCYDPLNERSIPVNPAPALENGFVTFGCLNNFCKINDDVLSLWARVMRQVENSRLLLLASEGSHRQRTLDRLSKEGIDSGRIQFAAQQPRSEYMQLYHGIDLSLDTFPYNGHTTSLDSFWMGVPVVTLIGQAAVARAGWSQLSNLGLTELAADTAERFVQITVELAGNLPRLGELRSKLRPRMEQSPLMDAPKFARNIEAAYRQMWQTWCATEPRPT